MHAYLGALKDTNVRSSDTLTMLKDHTEALSELQRGRDKDSKTIKALNAISTLYLSASLVASIFNSNLVQLVSQDATPTKFVPAPQSWIAVVFAMMLILLTYAAFYLLERKNKASRIRTAGSEKTSCIPLSSVATA